MTVLWKKHVYRAFKIYNMLQRKLKYCCIPYPWIAKNVIEYISIAGVSEEANVINFKARYDFSFQVLMYFPDRCGTRLPCDAISLNDSLMTVLRDLKIFFHLYSFQMGSKGGTYTRQNTTSEGRDNILYWYVDENGWKQSES